MPGAAQTTTLCRSLPRPPARLGGATRGTPDGSRKSTASIRRVAPLTGPCPHAWPRGRTSTSTTSTNPGAAGGHGHGGDARTLRGTSASAGEQDQGSVIVRRLAERSSCCSIVRRADGGLRHRMATTTACGCVSGTMWAAPATEVTVAGPAAATARCSHQSCDAIRSRDPRKLRPGRWCARARGRSGRLTSRSCRAPSNRARSVVPGTRTGISQRRSCTAVPARVGDGVHEPLGRRLDPHDAWEPFLQRAGRRIACSNAAGLRRLGEGPRDPAVDPRRLHQRRGPYFRGDLEQRLPIALGSAKAGTR